VAEKTPKDRPMLKFCLLACALFVYPVAVNANDKMVSAGTVEIEQTRISFIGSATGGGGILHFRGKDYPFKIGGLGIGGIGITKLEAVGTVYNLNDPSNFPGTYGEFRAGMTVGQGKNHLWLKNGNGTVLELKGQSKGVALNLGAGAVSIAYK
jgi:hypothetical protein